MKKLLILALLLLLGFPGFSDNIQEQLMSMGFQVFEEGTQFLDFEIVDLEGNNVKLSDFTDKTILLNFWATWCPPCISEMPSMQKLYDKFNDNGLVVIAVDLQEDDELVSNFIKQNNISFPVLLDKKGSAWSIYGASGIPVTYIITNEGNILGRIVGGKDWFSNSTIDFFLELLEVVE